MLKKFGPGFETSGLGTDEYLMWEYTKTTESTSLLTNNRWYILPHNDTVNQIAPPTTNLWYVRFTGVSSCTVAVIYILDTDPDSFNNIKAIFAFHRQGSVKTDTNSTPRKEMITAYSEWSKHCAGIYKSSRYKLIRFWLGSHGFRSTFNKTIAEGAHIPINYIELGGSHDEFLKSYKYATNNTIDIVMRNLEQMKEGIFCLK